MMNTELMMKVATLSNSVENAVNHVNICQAILDTLSATGERMRASEIAKKAGVIYADYPLTQKTTHWLRVLTNLGMVKREEIGTETIMISGHWACNGDPNKAQSWYLADQTPKEVPVAYYSIV